MNLVSVWFFSDSLSLGTVPKLVTSERYCRTMYLTTLRRVRKLSCIQKLVSTMFYMKINTSIKLIIYYKHDTLELVMKRSAFELWCYWKIMKMSCVESLQLQKSFRNAQRDTTLVRTSAKQKECMKRLHPHTIHIFGRILFVRLHRRGRPKLDYYKQDNQMGGGGAGCFLYVKLNN